MKKLNRKGFTLVELLAVIVILAIIVGIVFPQVMSAMDNSRISAIHSSAKGVVNWWENAKVADALITDNSKKQIHPNLLPMVTTSWKCIDTIKTTDGGVTYNLFDLAKLSRADLVISGTGINPPTGNPGTITAEKTCSAIRLNSTGGVDVILVAKTGGRYYISGKVTYGYSNDNTGKSI